MPFQHIFHPLHVAFFKEELSQRLECTVATASPPFRSSLLCFSRRPLSTLFGRTWALEHVWNSWQDKDKAGINRTDNELVETLFVVVPPPPFPGCS